MRIKAFAYVAITRSLKDMRSKGLVQPSATFAGHSLGEFSALASVADILPSSSLVDIMFYHGPTLQHAVEHDEQGRSNYGPSQPASQIYCPISPFSVPPDQPTSMPIRVASPAPVPSRSSSPLPAMCAVNPSRVGKTFDNAALCEIINTISNGRDCLLEIVNFNIEGQQYVSRRSTFPSAVEKQKAKDYIVLERGLTTIPLAGLGVPFHSHYRWSGVMPLRGWGLYPPNLVASPFIVNKDYAKLIYNRTSSPRLSEVLRKWDEERWNAPEQRQKLAWVLLIELLSYQFASLDLFFKQYKFKHFIEHGYVHPQGQIRDLKKMMTHSLHLLPPFSLPPQRLT
ncbi:hypothetical protein V8E52_006381 [Russula decolorans]